MDCDSERIKRRLEELSGFNATPGCGITRFSYSSEDREARIYLIEQMEAIGLSVSIDAVGNIRGRMEGTDPQAPPVITGSHIDTVFHGGKYDGAVGVICALEVLSVLKDKRLSGKHPVEIMIFSEEEGSNFDSTMAGSKAFAGKYTLEDLKRIRNRDGMTMYNMLKDAGLHPDTLPAEQNGRAPIKAFIELHVEQGGVLDAEKRSIGIVKGINGSRCLEIIVIGEANHAGATPMYLRHDPMVAAAMIICEIDQAMSRDVDATTVATVGKIHASPGISNCIAEEVRFTVDVRDIVESGIERVCRAIDTITARAEEQYGVKVSQGILAKSDVVTLSDTVIAILKEKAEARGVSYRCMNSGAVHDAAMLGSLSDVGMIFVPSIRGKSHVPEEDTRIEDITYGADLLLAGICGLAGIEI